MSTSDLSRPAAGIVAITPSDTTILAPGVRSLWVGTTGDVAVVCADGSTGTIPSATGLVPVQAKQVLLTGTTASGIVAFY